MNEAGADRIDNLHEHYWYDPSLLLHCRQHWRRIRHDHVRFHLHKLCGVSPHTIGGSSGPAIVDPNIAALRPAAHLEFLLQTRELSLRYRIVLGEPPLARQFAPFGQTAAHAPQVTT